jgi:hypothetical protein
LAIVFFKQTFFQQDFLVTYQKNNLLILRYYKNIILPRLFLQFKIQKKIIEERPSVQIEDLIAAFLNLSAQLNTFYLPALSAHFINSSTHCHLPQQ